MTCRRSALPLQLRSFGVWRDPAQLPPALPAPSSLAPGLVDTARLTPLQQAISSYGTVGTDSISRSAAGGFLGHDACGEANAAMGHVLPLSFEVELAGRSHVRALVGMYAR
jgi:hypothetical protein